MLTMFALLALVSANVENESDWNKRHYKAAVKACKAKWEPKGHRWRVGGAPVRPPATPHFLCEVEIDGNWLLEEEMHNGH